MGSGDNSLDTRRHGVILKMSGKQVGIEVALDIGGMNLKLK